LPPRRISSTGISVFDALAASARLATPILLAVPHLHQITLHIDDPVVTPPAPFPRFA
jgi:hypothetical protein